MGCVDFKKATVKFSLIFLLTVVIFLLTVVISVVIRLLFTQKRAIIAVVNKKIAPQIPPLYHRLSAIIPADIAVRVAVLLAAHAETRRVWKAFS